MAKWAYEPFNRGKDMSQWGQMEPYSVSSCQDSTEQLLFMKISSFTNQFKVCFSKFPFVGQKSTSLFMGIIQTL
jgi:hypothetical protein